MTTNGTGASDAAMSRMRDIADRLGVSVASVSRALNNRPGVTDELRRRVLEEATAQSYVPNPRAQAANVQGTRMIAFILHRREGSLAQDPFYPAILQGVGAEAAAAGYHVLVRSTNHADELQAAQLALFTERRVDACVVAGDDVDTRLILDLWRSGPPLILVNNAVEGVDVDSVETDNVAGARSITSHLIARHGYREIAMLVNSPLAWSTLRDRVLGYREAITKAGLAPMIIEAKSMNAPCATAALREYLEAGNRPRAVVAFNDSLALGAMHAIRAAGMRIPEDISVVGYDDIPGAALTDPPLTTVRIHTTQMGQEAARRLISQLQARGHDGAPPVPTRTILRNELVIRQSCGCPAAG